MKTLNRNKYEALGRFGINNYTNYYKVYAFQLLF